ncbi:MAG: Lipoprotein [Pseudoclavibacter caeni]|jgi:outer membrane murein-binding lipoprotein Lpp
MRRHGGRPSNLTVSTYGLMAFCLAGMLVVGCTSEQSRDEASSTVAPESSETGLSSTPSTSADATQGAPNPTASANDPGDGVARDAPEPTPSVQADDGRLQASVVVTRWGGNPFEAGGFVQGVVEDGGTCTLTLTRGDVQLKATGAGQAGPSGTDCGDGLTISDSRLAGDGWRLVLSYSSQRYSGSSTPQEVSIS